VRFIKLIIEYIIFIPLKRIFIFFTIKSSNKIYPFLFNIYARLINSETKIFLNKSNFFELKNSKWQFFFKNQGLNIYLRGLDNRKKDLQSTYLIKNLDFEDNDIIIDVGANNGDFYLCFDKKIKYYGIEPSPIAFQNLKANVNNGKLFNNAVWKSENNKIDFFLKEKYGDSSLIEMRNFTEKVQVQSITLDKIISEIGSKIKLVKLEAEGAEPEVLEGLKDNIDKIELITLDCGFERGINEESTFVICSNFLIQNNFQLIDFGKGRITALFKNKNIK